MSRSNTIIALTVTAVLIIACLVFGVWGVNKLSANQGYMMPSGIQMPMFGSTLQANQNPAPAAQNTPEASAPANTAPEVLSDQSAEYYFLPTNALPACFPVNGPWLEAFGNGQTYEIDPTDPIFDQSAFNYFEGVVVPSSPSDLHSTFEMTGKFVAEQGNVWTCGVVTDPKVKHTVLFQSADKKWQNLDTQNLAHPMKVTTVFGSWDYVSGEKPAWALEEDDTNMVCPFTNVSMSNPAGLIQADGSFVGAPGKAGCDFVAIYPDGSALRYHDAIDNFPYPAGTRFFLFEKSMTNEEVASALNVATVTDAQ